ncbi:hypothetical protein AVEN_59603-1 [Araneus ventricosus]|uniref:Uncharacterized protein n=1 Tax=Araneus ventricosus TaxID=182803 RepID=A0A4Y2J2D6_ARAVE|nr:hypothetical protein AVEN_59603-1 [Araneus ventricosus]
MLFVNKVDSFLIQPILYWRRYFSRRKVHLEGYFMMAGDQVTCYQRSVQNRKMKNVVCRTFKYYWKMENPLRDPKKSSSSKGENPPPLELIESGLLQVTVTVILK